jgi:RNA polymerase sigma-70 factor (ECF subfamily)
MKNLPLTTIQYGERTSMDDAAVIRTCLAGEREAFRLLVERYQREALGHALALLGHQEDARDAVQEAFLDAFRSLARFEPTRPFYPWLYVLLRNRCYKLLAGRKCRQAQPLLSAPLLARLAREETSEVAALEEVISRLRAYPKKGSDPLVLGCLTPFSDRL